MIFVRKQEFSGLKYSDVHTRLVNQLLLTINLWREVSRSLLNYWANFSLFTGEIHSQEVPMFPGVDVSTSSFTVRPW